MLGTAVLEGVLLAKQLSLEKAARQSQEGTKETQEPQETELYLPEGEEVEATEEFVFADLTKSKLERAVQGLSEVEDTTDAVPVHTHEFVLESELDSLEARPAPLSTPSTPSRSSLTDSIPSQTEEHTHSAVFDQPLFQSKSELFPEVCSDKEDEGVVRATEMKRSDSSIQASSKEVESELEQLTSPYDEVGSELERELSTDSNLSCEGPAQPDPTNEADLDSPDSSLCSTPHNPSSLINNIAISSPSPIEFTSFTNRNVSFDSSSDSSDEECLPDMNEASLVEELPLEATNSDTQQPQIDVFSNECQQELDEASEEPKSSLSPLPHSVELTPQHIDHEADQESGRFELALTSEAPTPEDSGDANGSEDAVPIADAAVILEEHQASHDSSEVLGSSHLLNIHDPSALHSSTSSIEEPESSFPAIPLGSLPSSRSFGNTSENADQESDPEVLGAVGSLGLESSTSRLADQELVCSEESEETKTETETVDLQSEVKPPVLLCEDSCHFEQPGSPTEVLEVSSEEIEPLQLDQSEPSLEDLTVVQTTINYSGLQTGLPDFEPYNSSSEEDEYLSCEEEEEENEEEKEREDEEEI